MIPEIPSGYSLQLVGMAETIGDMVGFEPAEHSLTVPTRELLCFQLESGQDVSDIAQSIENACVAHGMAPWPEYPATHTFIDDDSIYVTYMGMAYQSQIAWLMPVLIGIAILAPILLYFTSESFREIINLMIMLPIMFIMMKLMRTMTKTIGKKEEKKEEKKVIGPPWEERVLTRLESVAERVAKVKSLVASIGKGAAPEVVSTASEIGEIARTIRAVPKTAMSGYAKGEAATEMSKLQRTLAKYEEILTPEQKAKLAEARRMVGELREQPT